MADRAGSGATNLIFTWIPMSDRPYLTNGIEQLEARAATAWNDLEILVSLSLELKHRETQRARALRDRMIRRIAELQYGSVPPRSAGVQTSDVAARRMQEPEPPAILVRDDERGAGGSAAPSASLVATAAGLGRLSHAIHDVRRRLLDLSGRNRLLNFRFTKRTLRVVGEVPDLLFRRLDDGRAMTFAPVPEPPRQAGGEPQTEPDAAPELSLTADLLIAQEAAAPESATACPGGWPRLRKQRRRLPPVEQEAKRLGISTDWDLALTPVSEDDDVDPRLTDSYIQTLYYPEDLEAVVSKIFADARLVEQETGANLLQMSFGMLEWYDSEEADKSRLAPLLLLQVTLTKRPLDHKTGTFGYAVQGAGEDPMVNVSLQEKLRQDFGVVLPDLNEAESCASYLGRAREAVRSKRRWMVRGYVTLGLVQFGKILMYRDLDSGTWPDDAGPEQHPGLRELFEGGAGSEAFAVEDYAIDERASATLPPLILNADSSQHSALIDALSGKNLVIEGPPGTGKSQTITNLLAAAIGRGLKVLFVAEKAAALQVVHKRLADARFHLPNGDEASLADFVLELHSHKAKKRQVLDDLERRLLLHSHLACGADLEAAEKALENQRQLLIDHAKLMATPYGGAQCTVHQILWGVHRWKDEVADALETLDRIDLPESLSLGAAELEERLQRLEQHGAHARTAAAVAGRITEHPWWGLEGDGLGFADVARLKAGVRQLCAAAEAFEKALLTTAQGLPWLRMRSERDVLAIRHAVVSLEPDELVDADLLAQLRDDGAQEVVSTFVRALQALYEATAAARGTFGVSPVLDAKAITEVRNGVSRLGEFAPRAGSPHAAAEDAERLFSTARECRRVASVVQVLDGVAPAWGTPTVRHAVQAEAISGVLRDTARAVATHRHQALRADDAIGAIEVIRAKVGAYAALRSKLEQRVRLDLLPPPAEVTTHLSSCVNASWWSFLSSTYRRARRTHRVLSLERKPSCDEAINDYRAIATLFARRRETLEAPGFRELSGPFWRGEDTPLEALAQAADCWQRLRRQAAEQPAAISAELLDQVWSLSASQFNVALERAPLVADAAQARNLASALAAVARDAPALALEEMTGVPLVELAERFERRAAAIQDGLRVIVPAIPDVAWPLQRVLEFLDCCDDLRMQELLLDSARSAAAVLGAKFRGHRTVLTPVRATVEYLGALRASPLPPAGVAYLWHADLRGRWSQLTDRAHALGLLADELRTAEASFFRDGGIGGLRWYQDTSTREDRPITRVAERADRADEETESLTSWLEYQASSQRLLGLGLKALADAVESGELDASRLAAGFQYVYHRSLAMRAFRQHRALGAFNGTDHDATQQRFRQLDEKMLGLTRAKLAAAGAARHVPYGNASGSVQTYTERALLQREIGKQKKHIALRQLLTRAAQAIQALKPCFMMSPLSVAQYLEPGVVSFDIVVMDEASQLRPEDALGVIARAKQLVVVGDQKQLPPTTFFDAIGDEEEPEHPEEDITVGVKEAESILEVASKIYTPSRMLRWHYRSRHGSLIAFSNEQFYKNRLVVFPAPEPAGEDLGVSLVHVQNGIWDGETNHAEAELVASAVLHHMETRPDRSLGVATMNATQRDLIQAEVELLTKASPLAQAYLQSWGNEIEDFFVKNLENVQGDERDVIFISITYGPKTHGQPPHQHWGPLNGATGARRLNVLFTRAKYQVVVFSSITADQVVVSEKSSEGARILREYLSYAQTGRISDLEFTDRPPGSDFEIAVGRMLKAAGYQVVPQLGVAGFFLDLAVRDPVRPGAFLAGVECDGAAYHSSKSARDRDRLRQMILEDLGWYIHRIWSAEWFKHPERETARLLAALRQRQTLRQRETAVVAPASPVPL